MPRSLLQPPRKPHITKILPHITGLRTDEQLHEFIEGSRQSGATALVNFGSSWCRHCHELFPAFLSLSKQFPRLSYAVAQVRRGHW